MSSKEEVLDLEAGYLRARTKLYLRNQNELINYIYCHSFRNSPFGPTDIIPQVPGFFGSVKVHHHGF